MDGGFLIKCFDRFVYMGIKHGAVVDSVSAARSCSATTARAAAKAPGLESVNGEREVLKAMKCSSCRWHLGLNRIYRGAWSIFGSVNSCIHSCSWADTSVLSHEVQTWKGRRGKLVH